MFIVPNIPYTTERIIEAHQHLLTQDDVELFNILIRSDQFHLFKSWDPPGINDDKKISMMSQLKDINDVSWIHCVLRWELDICYIISCFLFIVSYRHILYMSIVNVLADCCDNH